MPRCPGFFMPMGRSYLTAADRCTAYYAWRTDPAYMTPRRMAERLGIGERTAQRLLGKFRSLAHLPFNEALEQLERFKPGQKKGAKPPSFKGKRHSEETKQRISAAGKGRRHSLETKQKISATMRRR